MSNITALITGASGGIGLEFAKIHADNKYDLVLVARNETKLFFIKKELEAKYGITAHVFATDLSIEGNVKSLVAFTDKNDIRVDHLINNAGIGVYGKFHETDLDSNLKLLDLNNRALVILTKLYSDKMVKHGYGKVLNVASTAAFGPGPFYSCYFASKAFVLSFSEAIHSELENTGVSVTTLCPGPTETGFVSATKGMVKSGLFAKQKVSSPKEVAKDGYDTMMDNGSFVISGLMNKISVFSMRFAPRSWVTAITKSITKPLD
jgi:short-subunit dehydrogenase